MIIINHNKAATIQVDQVDSGALRLEAFGYDSNGIYSKIPVSDGYHTFDELYEHRYLLFFFAGKAATLLYLNMEHSNETPFWMTNVHSDGTLSYPGYFLAGIFDKPGKQMTYHIPDKHWELYAEYAKVLDIAPSFDGHTSDDVLERLKTV